MGQLFISYTQLFIVADIGLNPIAVEPVKIQCCTNGAYQEKFLVAYQEKFSIQPCKKQAPPPMP